MNLKTMINSQTCNVLNQDLCVPVDSEKMVAVYESTDLLMAMYRLTGMICGHCQQRDTCHPRRLMDLEEKTLVIEPNLGIDI